MIVNPTLSNHVRRVSLSNPTNSNSSSGGPMRVNIPGGLPDVAQESEETNPRRPIAAISPFSRDNKPIDNEVVIHRDRDPRLRNQSTGSADETLRFPNGQAVRDGPLNTCDSYTTSGGRNQCHIAKGNICKSFEEKWENREQKMAGIGIGKYPTGDAKDQERGINNNHLKHGQSKPGPSKSRPSESGTPKPKSLDEALSNFYEALPPLPSPPPGGSQEGRPGSANPQGQNLSDRLLPLPLPPPRSLKGSHPSMSKQPKTNQPKVDQLKNDQPKNGQPKNDPFKNDQPKTEQSKNGHDSLNHAVRSAYNSGQQPRFRGQWSGPRPCPRVGHCFKRSQWQPNAWAPPRPHFFHGPTYRPFGYLPQPMPQPMRPGPNRPVGWQGATQMAQWQQGYGQGQVWYPRHGHPPVRQNRPQRPPQNSHWYDNYYLFGSKNGILDHLKFTHSSETN